MSTVARGGLGLRRHLVIAALIAAVVGVGAYGVVLAERPAAPLPSPATPVASATLHAGSPAPVDFRLAELAGHGSASFSSLVAGHPTIVNFFASWCVACQAELSTLARYARHVGGGVRVIGIDTDEHDLGASRALVARAHVAYPVLLDGGDDPVQAAYGLGALPVTFFIDAAGHVRRDHLGQVTTALLRADTASIRRP